MCSSDLKFLLSNIPNRITHVAPCTVITVNTVTDGAVVARAAPVSARGGETDDDEPHRSVGLANVDGRLRAVYGDEYGLVVETAPGAGTKVIVRVPKFAPGVHA